MSRLLKAFAAAGLLCAAGAANGQELARPDPFMTPGAVDPSVTLADICTGTTKTRRHVSPATRTRVLRDYYVADTASVGMKMDHLIPLALGGANTAPTRRQPVARAGARLRDQGSPGDRDAAARVTSLCNADAGRG